MYEQLYAGVGYLWLCKHGLCDFMWVIVEVDDADGSFAQTLAPVIQQTSNWSERRNLKKNFLESRGVGC